MANVTTTGTVTTVYSKKVGNRGGKTHSFILNDDGVWFNCGFDDPKLKEGDEITFEWCEDEYAPGKVSNKVDIDTIVIGTPAPKDNPKKTPAGKKGASSRDDYWNQKAEDDRVRQNIISFQAAFNTATSIVNTVVSQDPEVFEAIAGKTKKNRTDKYLSYVEGVAIDIFEKFLHGNDLATEILKKEEESVNHSAGDSLDD